LGLTVMVSLTGPGPPPPPPLLIPPGPPKFPPPRPPPRNPSRSRSSPSSHLRLPENRSKPPPPPRSGEMPLPPPGEPCRWFPFGGDWRSKPGTRPLPSPPKPPAPLTGLSMENREKHARCRRRWAWLQWFRFALASHAPCIAHFEPPISSKPVSNA
jgi:hypothetical protein